MAHLTFVADYIAEARALLQDTVLPNRYTQASLIDALNNGYMEVIRLRPDLFFKAMRSPLASTQLYDSVLDTVQLDLRYRNALLSYIVGWAQLQDHEDTSDTRGAAFVQQFTAKLMTLQA